MHAWLSFAALFGCIVSLSAAESCGDATDGTRGQCLQRVPVRGACGSDAACRSALVCLGFENAPGANCTKSSTESGCQCLAPKLACGSGEEVFSCSACVLSSPMADKKSSCASDDCTWDAWGETCNEFALDKFSIAITAFGPFLAFLLVGFAVLMLVVCAIMAYDAFSTDCQASVVSKYGTETESEAAALTSRGLGRVTYASDDDSSDELKNQQETQVLMSNRVTQENAEIGRTVVRGADWDNNDEDGGKGSTGTLVGPIGALWLVKWDNGSVRPYEIGGDDADGSKMLFELSYLSKGNSN